MNSKDDILVFLLEHMSKKTSPTVINAWFEDAKIADLNEHTIVIETTAPFKRDILRSYYTEPVKEAVQELLGVGLEVSFVTSGEIRSETDKLPAPVFSHNEYTFEKFIVGESNKYAANGAKAVAERPGQAYNPLLIYGDSGLGKTHLLYAILDHVKRTRPEYVALDFTGETFTNELASAIRHGTTADFREKYRTPDMILVDDIQFIGGKDFAQEEFFHTFNALYQVGCQIVVTSDRPPRDMPLLEERLRTRFDAGLLVDIKPPDFVTRMAIIKAKALQLNLFLDDDVVVFIAESISNNIRQLEGSVKKLTAYGGIFGKITLDTAQRVISDLIRTSPGLNPTPEFIIKEVCEYFHIEEKVLLGNSRKAAVVSARQIAMYIARSLTDVSLQNMGFYFRRDHSTVLHGVTKIENERLTNQNLDAQIRAIIENIKGK